MFKIVFLFAGILFGRTTVSAALGTPAGPLGCANKMVPPPPPPQQPGGQPQPSLPQLLAALLKPHLLVLQPLSPQLLILQQFLFEKSDPTANDSWY